MVTTNHVDKCKCHQSTWELMCCKIVTLIKLFVLLVSKCINCETFWGVTHSLLVSRYYVSSINNTTIFRAKKYCTVLQSAGRCCEKFQIA
jgi:hypothetical protein